MRPRAWGAVRRSGVRASREGFRSPTVLHKLGHDLRARLDDTVGAALPLAFAPMLAALGQLGSAGADARAGGSRAGGPRTAGSRAPEPATGRVLPFARSP